MRVADYVIKFLADHGIDHAFGVCGGGGIFLFDALRKSERVKFVACHHEQAAAMAAEAYARVRTGIGCAVVTSGPGGTNAITGVAGAWTDSVPTITISGQVFLSQTVGQSGLRTLGVQEINIVEMVRPITKYAVMVTKPSDIRYHLEKAFWMATYGRPGPVWLDIPADIQNAEVDPFSMEGFWPHPAVSEARLERTRIMRDQIKNELIPLLAQAKRPLIHIGQGIRLSGALPELMKFIQAFQIPVVTARNGNDLIASDHPLYAGRPGTFAQRGANFAVQTCDLYVAIGTRLGLAQTGYNAKDYARNAKIVHVEIDPAEANKNTVNTHLPIIADAKEFLNALIAETCEMVEIKPLGVSPYWVIGKIMTLEDWELVQKWLANGEARKNWLAQCKKWQAQYPVGQPREPSRAGGNNYDLIDAISDALTPGDVVVSDMGTIFQNLHQAFRVKTGQRLFTNCGLASMGWGLPAAIGASFGSGKRVVCLSGDGGFSMTMQELAVLKHHALNVKVFIVDNGGYTTMRQSQSHAFGAFMGSSPDSGLSFPKFNALAAAFEIPDFYSHDIYPPLIQKFLDEPGPGVMVLKMDPDQPTIPKSLNERLPDGTIRQTSLEDAHPFLSRGEVEEQMKIATQQ